MKTILNKTVALFTVISIFLGMLCVVGVSAEVSELTVVASADFDNATTALGSYTGVEFKHTANGAVSGEPVIYESSNPYNGKQMKYTQAVLGSTNYQWMEFKLDSPIGIGDNASENSYAEISCDMKLENSNTGINFEFGSEGYLSGKQMYRFNIGQAGGVTSTGAGSATAHTTSSATGTISIYHNIRIRMDLKNKTVVGIYVDDDLIDLSDAPIGWTNADGKTTIDILRIYMGRANRAGDLSIDNVNVVTYTSSDGTSPIANKANLRLRIEELAMQNSEGSQKEKLLAAAQVAKNPIATQVQVDEAYESLGETVEPETKEGFTLKETFESQLEESVFDVGYGAGIVEYENYEEAAYGQGSLKLKTDASLKNVSQYVDFGFGKKGVRCSNEDPNCYVEFGIDFASYNMSLYNKNVFVYFRETDSNKNLSNLYITGGTGIRISGIPSGEVTLGSIEEPEKMKNIRVIMQMTDSEGNASQNITAVYADDVLLPGNYPIPMTQLQSFDKVRVMISDVKDSDFGLDKEWGTNIDNITVTKFYSPKGKSNIHTAGELVSLMRSYDTEALANYKDKIYTEEQYNTAQDAINAAALVYMDVDSTDEQIDLAYKDLYSVKKRMTMADGRTFDITGVSTSADVIEGNDEISINVSVVTSEKITQPIAPTLAGFIMKKSDAADELVYSDFSTITLEPNDNGEFDLYFDVSEYTDAEKADMYVRLFVFENIWEMKIDDTELPVLFNNESVVNNEDYRYSSEMCAYQIIEDDVVSVFTAKGEKDKSNTILIFKEDFDYTDFSDEKLVENLVYVNVGKFDGNGRSAFSVKGIPNGEYTYYLNGNKGIFAASDAEDIEGALSEVCENPEKLEEKRYILGIDEGIYNSAKANGIEPSDILDDILDDKSYSVADVQEFGDYLVLNITMINEFKSVKTTDYVRDVMETYFEIISNASKYEALKGKKQSYADIYILDKRSDIVSINALEEVIEDAVAYAENQSNSTSETGGNRGGGGGGSYPSASAVKTKSESKENEYGVITEINTKEFADLDNYEWAKPAIALLVKKGSVNGKAEGVFAPGDKVTREEFIKMLLLTFDYEIERTSTTAFSDVDSSLWYAPYVMSAVKQGIVKGVSDTMFGTGELISREDAVVLIARVLENKKISFTADGEYISFIDDAYISDYARKAVEEMTMSGIVNGMAGNRFAPKDNTTRAEAAKLIYEAYMFMVTKEE